MKYETGERSVSETSHVFGFDVTLVERGTYSEMPEHFCSWADTDTCKWSGKVFFEKIIARASVRACGG